MTKLTRDQVEQIVTEARQKGEKPALSRADLREVDLSGMDLHEADLRWAYLLKADLSRTNCQKANLIGADLSEVNFRGAQLNEANLIGAGLNGANFRGANLVRADLSGADLLGVNFSGANLQRAFLNRAKLFEANLRRANLIGANLSEAFLSMTNLREADLNGANLIEANLSKAKLNNANLSLADLRGANLIGANLRLATILKANLRWADLREADLREADLSNADLSNADLRRTYLNRTNFRGAKLIEASFSRAMVGATSFTDVDLSTALELETVKHYGPSTIGIDTMTKSQGNIPHVFLQGCGLNDAQIEMVKLHDPTLSAKKITDITYKIHNLMVENPILYYSCFISYAHQDDDFAQRLYADLQSKGVRCWFAPRDMKIGAKIRYTIDESIRIHDKLLLVLSKHSVASEWVEHEVEHALGLEQERDEPILFPVRLDEAVMESNSGWSGNIKRGRHIGNFTEWADQDVYQQAFNQLLQDLKTTG